MRGNEPHPSSQKGRCLVPHHGPGNVRFHLRSTQEQGGVSVCEAAMASQLISVSLGDDLPVGSALRDVAFHLGCGGGFILVQGWA